MTRKEERKFLFNKTNGRCAYCGCELPDRWHVDHMKPVIRKIVGTDEHHRPIFGKEFRRPELDTLDNKVASCPACNIKKGCSSVEGFRSEIESRLEVLNQHAPYKLAKKFGQLKETPVKVVFYFETLNSKSGDNIG